MSQLELIILIIFGVIIALSTLTKCWLHYVKYKRAKQFMIDSREDMLKKVAEYKKRYPDSYDPMVKLRQDYHDHIVEKRAKKKSEDIDPESEDPPQD